MRIKLFPSNLIASRHRLRTSAVFELADPADRAVPGISLP